MRFAADLHLHSHYSSAVSPAMTVENIALWAQRKGVSLLGTGDCLQAQWLDELAASLEPAEPGLFALKPEIAARVRMALPEALRGHLRFVLSTEVSCAPPGTMELGGVHCLIYFPTFASARDFRKRMEPYGDLGEGRPSLLLAPRQLLQSVLDHDQACRFAPAHVFNPWYSALGTVSGGRTMDEVFGELTPRLSMVETGLTSIPPMCRRIESLDRFALYSCSDAHSLENIGRECTLLEIEPSYEALFTALQKGATPAVQRTLKFPLQRTRYYLNRCGTCKDSFEGRKCPKCGRPLVMGARDRLAVIATRPEPRLLPSAPSFGEFLPLNYLLADISGQTPQGAYVKRMAGKILEATGPERFVLTEASYDEIARASSSDIARAIREQREGRSHLVVKKVDLKTISADNSQLSLDLG